MSERDNRLAQLVGELQGVADQLGRAVEETARQRFEGRASDGSIRVEVDGRGRVTAIEVSPSVVGRGSEALNAALAPVVNGALDQARQATARATAGSLPPRLRSEVDRAVDHARNGGYA